MASMVALASHEQGSGFNPQYHKQKKKGILYNNKKGNND
jgi:hypothetical protein